MAGLELVKNRATRAPFGWAQKVGMRVTLRARRKGSILRPLGPVVVLMPPLAISAAELDQLLDITYESVREEARVFEREGLCE